MRQMELNFGQRMKGMEGDNTWKSGKAESRAE
jgi:hypothetical protein